QLVNDAILQTRAQRGLEVIQTLTSLKAVVDAMWGGQRVAIVGDQDAGGRGIFVDFFGRPAGTAPGVATVVCLVNATVLPAFCVRIDDTQRHLRVMFTPAIYPEKSAEREQDMYRITQEHTAALEQVVRRHPEDYFWLHRRWKTQPKVKK